MSTEPFNVLVQETDEGGGPSLSEEEMKQRKTKAVMSWLVCLGTRHLLQLSLWCSVMARMAVHFTVVSQLSLCCNARCP